MFTRLLLLSSKIRHPKTQWIILKYEWIPPHGQGSLPLCFYRKLVSSQFLLQQSFVSNHRSYFYFVFYLIVYLKDLFSSTTGERSLSYTLPLSKLCELKITLPHKTKIETSDYLVTEETTLPPLINSLLPLHIIHKELLISISDLINLIYINNFNNKIITMHFGKFSF